MFRKTWKTIKIFAVIAVVLIIIPRSFLPHQNSDIENDIFENYRKLNESEKRLSQYKDDDEALRLKLIQLDVINNSRKKFRAGSVKLDILASRVANKMCREAAENSYVGHWNLAGEKPYQRYAFAGGYDHISENAFGEWSTQNYYRSSSTITAMMKSGHEKFMSERAPYDGHKETIIDKSHNFVGIGYYLSGKQFRYYEEFIDRYFEFENIPVEVMAGQPFSITLKRTDGNYLHYLVVYYEKYPRPLSPEQIRSKDSYDDFTDEQYLKMYAWDLARYRNGTTYRIPLNFSREGLYYIQVYYDSKEITKPTEMTTKGKSAVSGIVIKVN
jgi:hypothetical protein